MAQPAPWIAVSDRWSIVSIGAAGGVIGGMYGAGGAPLAWFMYRQPLDLNVIRATLLATFFVSTLSRSVIVALSGDLTHEVLLVALASVPIVIVSTVVSTRLAHRVPDRAIRRFVFVLLILLGLSLIVSSLAGR